MVNKVKIKLPYSYYIIISGFLSDLENEGYELMGKDIITAQVLSTGLNELNRMLLDVVYMNQYDHSSRKIITKSFSDSYGLNFFGLFYGSNIDGYAKIPIKEMCNQLEHQLFISGPYLLPHYVSKRKN